MVSHSAAESSGFRAALLDFFERFLLGYLFLLPGGLPRFLAGGADVVGISPETCCSSDGP